jgi:hypothetical protein
MGKDTGEDMGEDKGDRKFKGGTKIRGVTLFSVKE